SQRLQFFDDRSHRAFGIAEKFRAANAREDRAHALKNGLAVQVFLEPVERMTAVAVALDGQALAISFDDEIEAERAHLPLRRDVVGSGLETLHVFSFEGRLAALFLFIEGAHQSARILSV